MANKQVQALHDQFVWVTEGRLMFLGNAEDYHQVIGGCAEAYFSVQELVLTLRL